MNSETQKADVQPGTLPVSAEVDLWPRPRRNRHHRIDAACGHNFCHPAHKIIPMDGQNHLREMQRYVAMSPSLPLRSGNWERASWKQHKNFLPAST